MFWWTAIFWSKAVGLDRFVVGNCLVRRRRVEISALRLFIYFFYFRSYCDVMRMCHGRSIRVPEMAKAMAFLHVWWRILTQINAPPITFEHIFSQINAPPSALKFLLTFFEHIFTPEKKHPSIGVEVSAHIFWAYSHSNKRPSITFLSMFTLK